MTMWVERLAERSPSVQRSRDRSVAQASVLVEAARRLITEDGESFTIQQLATEAGVALQTFYRYFASKDELLLAVLEDLILQACESFRLRASGLDDPVERLHSHVTAVVALLDEVDASAPAARFITSEHWRLSRLFPAEVAAAIRPYADLLQAEISAATDAGTLRSVDPERDAWLIEQLVLSVFHHHTCSGTTDPDLADDLWRFCLQGLALAPTEP